ncbi:Conserved_hypothetical protein [Hexamita inflata]|uniref:Uncharacterized protein n=1 Tax=Hexamita inflata TaxID=28002 RepID=A0AA86R3Y8_9EUKA|nr:Conserved hypothetical protein [Hexamita inflata]
MICGQPQYVSSFDINSVSNSISSSNFTNGSVFGSINNVQNAFIDIQNGAYETSVQPLFAAQNQFYNIKIQVGNQIVNNGQILSSNNAIIINQMSIVSRSQTVFRIIQQVSILQTSSIDTHIREMLLNLTVLNSTGNLGLIGSLTGSLSIKNYQISGNYETQGSMSLGVIIASSSIIIIKYVNFLPNLYNYGNESSYLFSSLNQCNVELSKITVNLGNQSYQFNLSQQPSTNSTQQQFGGFVSNTNSSRILISEISYVSYLSCTTQFMTKSGLILGIVNSSTSQTVLQGLCFYTSINATTNLEIFGLIGKLDGNVTFKLSQINNIINDSTIINNYGTIGKISLLSAFSSFQDLIISQNIYLVSGGINAGLIAQQYSIQSQYYNITLENSIFNCTGISGGLLAQTQSNASLQNIKAYNININSTGDSGAVIAQSSLNIQLINIVVNISFVNSIQYVGEFIASTNSNTKIYYGQIINISVSSAVNNLGGVIGILSPNQQAIIQNINASDTKIFSLTACSTGTIIGITDQNSYAEVQSAFVIGVNISANGGGGSAGIVGFSYAKTLISQSTVLNLYMNSSSNGVGAMIGQSYEQIINECKAINIILISVNRVGGFVGLQQLLITISNGYVNNLSITTNQQAGGIIGLLCQNASINNASINNVIIQCGQQAGGLVGQSQRFVQISQSLVNNTKINSNMSTGGGLVGTVTDAIIQQCQVNNIEIFSVQQCGGIVGSVSSSNQLIINIVKVNNATLGSTQFYSIGGIVGISDSFVSISNSSVYNIVINAVGCNGAAGIIGYSTSNSSLSNNIVNYLYINSTAQGSSGIIGQSNISIIVNCSVSNTFINASLSSGGIIGYSLTNVSTLNQQLSTSIQNCYVHNLTILQSTISGGVIGYYSSVQKLSISYQTINTVNLKTQSQHSIVIGKSLLSTYQIDNSSSYGQNIINGVTQVNCPALNTTTNINGC